MHSDLALKKEEAKVCSQRRELESTQRNASDTAMPLLVVRILLREPELDATRVHAKAAV